MNGFQIAGLAFGGLAFTLSLTGQVLATDYHKPPVHPTPVVVQPPVVNNTLTPVGVGVGNADATATVNNHVSGGDGGSVIFKSPLVTPTISPTLAPTATVAPNAVSPTISPTVSPTFEQSLTMRSVALPSAAPVVVTPATAGACVGTVTFGQVTSSASIAMRTHGGFGVSGTFTEGADDLKSVGGAVTWGSSAEGGDAADCRAVTKNALKVQENLAEQLSAGLNSGAISLDQLLFTSPQTILNNSSEAKQHQFQIGGGTQKQTPVKGGG